MGKLRALAPRLKILEPRSANRSLEAMTPDQKRDAEQPWRRWYKTSRWQKLRIEVLERDMFTCQMEGCGQFVADTSQLVADHKKQHHGSYDLFWDDRNLQTLCKTCHDSIKARLEGRPSYQR